MATTSSTGIPAASHTTSPRAPGRRDDGFTHLTTMRCQVNLLVDITVNPIVPWEDLMHGMRGLHGSRPAAIAVADRAPAQRDGTDRERRPWSLLVLLSVAQF